MSPLPGADANPLVPDSPLELYLALKQALANPQRHAPLRGEILSVDEIHRRIADIELSAQRLDEAVKALPQDTLNDAMKRVLLRQAGDAVDSDDALGRLRLGLLGALARRRRGGASPSPRGRLRFAAIAMKGPATAEAEEAHEARLAELDIAADEFGDDERAVAAGELGFLSAPGDAKSVQAALAGASDVAAVLDAMGLSIDPTEEAWIEAARAARDVAQDRWAERTRRAIAGGGERASAMRSMSDLRQLMEAIAAEQGESIDSRAPDLSKRSLWNRGLHASFWLRGALPGRREIVSSPSVPAGDEFRPDTDTLEELRDELRRDASLRPLPRVLNHLVLLRAEQGTAEAVKAAVQMGFGAAVVNGATAGFCQHGPQRRDLDGKSPAPEQATAIIHGTSPAASADLAAAFEDLQAMCQRELRDAAIESVPDELRWVVNVPGSVSAPAATSNAGPYEGESAKAIQKLRSAMARGSVGHDTLSAREWLLLADQAHSLSDDTRRRARVPAVATLVDQMRIRLPEDEATSHALDGARDLLVTRGVAGIGGDRLAQALLDGSAIEFQRGPASVKRPAVLGTKRSRQEWWRPLVSNNAVLAALLAVAAGWLLWPYLSASSASASSGRTRSPINGGVAAGAPTPEGLGLVRMQVEGNAELWVMSTPVTFDGFQSIATTTAPSASTSSRVEITVDEAAAWCRTWHEMLQARWPELFANGGALAGRVARLPSAGELASLPAAAGARTTSAPGSPPAGRVSSPKHEWTLEEVIATTDRPALGALGTFRVVLAPSQAPAPLAKERGP